MSMPPSKPTLSIGNQLYLYRLLRDALGCGKQTLMPAVEQALSDADMAAVDLGFESTREMLEQLDTCMQLTVFKGGRIYATVIAQPAWDEALAASPSKQGQQVKNVKSWKKKKRDKTLKAVKPKHVKRPEPEPEPEPAVVEEPAVAAGDAEAVEGAAPDAAAVENDAVFDVETLVAEDAAVEAEAEVEPSSEEPAASEAPQPAISVTVVYDPEHANAGVQTIESSPVEEAVSEEEPVAEPVEEPVPVAADTAEPKPKPEPEPVAAPVSEPAPKPAIPDGYPVDFTTEVFCPGTLLSELSQLLPYGADAMGIVGEYYWIARENGSIDAQRNRATFALRYTRDGERREAGIRIRRNTEGGLGAVWTIDHIEHL